MRTTRPRHLGPAGRVPHTLRIAAGDAINVPAMLELDQSLAAPPDDAELCTPLAPCRYVRPFRIPAGRSVHACAYAPCLRQLANAEATPDLFAVACVTSTKPPTIPHAPAIAAGGSR